MLISTTLKNNADDALSIGYHTLKVSANAFKVTNQEDETALYKWYKFEAPKGAFTVDASSSAALSWEIKVEKEAQWFSANINKTITYNTTSLSIPVSEIQKVSGLNEKFTIVPENDNTGETNIVLWQHNHDGQEINESKVTFKKVDPTVDGYSPADGDIYVETKNDVKYVTMHFPAIDPDANDWGGGSYHLQ